jgi:tetratricopeptide (TPR) repeat protein
MTTSRFASLALPTARPQSRGRAAVVAALLLVVAGCQLPPPYEPPRAPEPVPPARTPDAPPARTEAPPPTPPEPAPPPPPQREFRLGAASASLVAQARSQSEGGHHGLAAATLERALRIEPENPLVWVELARVRQAEGNHAQADAMGRKALSLATGDPRAQSAAWQVIAESLRARGRNAEAAEADQQASLAR